MLVTQYLSQAKCTKTLGNKMQSSQKPQAKWTKNICVRTTDAYQYYIVDFQIVTC